MKSPPKFGGLHLFVLIRFHFQGVFRFLLPSEWCCKAMCPALRWSICDNYRPPFNNLLIQVHRSASASYIRYCSGGVSSMIQNLQARFNSLFMIEIYHFQSEKTVCLIFFYKSIIQELFYLNRCSTRLTYLCLCKKLNPAEVNSHSGAINRRQAKHKGNRCRTGASARAPTSWKASGGPEFLKRN